MTVERLRAFAAAAAAFYEARIWQHLANEDLIVVGARSALKSMRHVSVLGQAGQQFGLAFFDSRREFDRLVSHTGRGGPPKRAHGVTFGPIDELPFADGDAWEDYARPVAGPRAYPLAADLYSDGGVGRPGPRELTCCEALLGALAATTEDELDSGRWEKRGETFDGPLTVTLSLPLLLDGEKNSGSAALRRSAMGLPPNAVAPASRVSSRANRSNRWTR